MLFQNAVRLLKDKETIKKYIYIYNKNKKITNLINQSQIYTWLIKMQCNIELKCIFETERQAKAEMCDTFYCTIEPLNLSDFMMNLIDLNMLQFCWSLNLPLP